MIHHLSQDPFQFIQVITDIILTKDIVIIFPSPLSTPDNAVFSVVVAESRTLGELVNSTPGPDLVLCFVGHWSVENMNTGSG